MNKISLILIFCMVFVLFSSCARKSLEEDFETGYWNAKKCISDEQGTWSCFTDKISRYCDENSLWQYQDCDSGCDWATGRCRTDDPTNPTDDPTSFSECEIDDSFLSSSFDNHYTFKGAGTIHENNGDYNPTTVTTTSLYLENYPDLSFVGQYTAFDITIDTLSNGEDSIFLDTVSGDSSSGFANIIVHASIPTGWLNDIKKGEEAYPEYFHDGKAPFAPMVIAYSMDLRLDESEQNVERYKQCTIAVTPFVGSKPYGNDMPEGSFQACYDRETAIKAGQQIALGIDAHLVDTFEEIQTVFNSGVMDLYDAGRYIETQKDLCRCYDTTEGSEIDCDNF